MYSRIRWNGIIVLPKAIGIEIRHFDSDRSSEYLQVGIFDQRAIVLNLKHDI